MITYYRQKLSIRPVYFYLCHTMYHLRVNRIALHLVFTEVEHHLFDLTHKIIRPRDDKDKDSE